MIERFVSCCQRYCGQRHRYGIITFPSLAIYLPPIQTSQYHLMYVTDLLINLE